MLKQYLWHSEMFRSFKIPAITLIWPKSLHKHSVTRSYCSGKESGRRWESPLWVVTSSMTFLCPYISHWWRQTWDMLLYFTVVTQSEARISTEHGITLFITQSTTTWYYMLTLNPLRAKFFRGSMNIYLHFVSFLHIGTTQVVEILPQIRQEPTYST